jgi:uncharacterized protein (DUF1499 family)
MVALPTARSDPDNGRLPSSSGASVKPIRPVLFVLAAATAVGCASVVQPQYGVSGGVLYPCPESRACVSSQDADAKRKVEPLTYTSDRREARTDLIAAINSFAGVRIVSSHRNYLRAEFPSKAIKNQDANEFYFAARAGVDDVELWFPPNESVIHVRSAARLGLLDSGENRERVDTLRARFAQLQAKRATTPR